MYEMRITTPTTHTYNELLAIFNENTEDGTIGKIQIDKEHSMFIQEGT